MADTVIIDFSQVEEPKGPRPVAARRDKLTRSREDVGALDAAGPALMSALLPSINEAAPGHGVTLPAELIEAAKATFISSGGNVAEVVRVHDLAPTTVTRLAAKNDWPVYGDGTTSAERSRKTRLHNLADMLENRLFQLADSMGVEKKEVQDITEKGMGSRYVAALNQRSSAFSAVFDRYMRVMALLEPEVFAADDDPSNPMAARVRAKQGRDALGGVDGVDRRLAEFAARVAVSTLEAQRDGQALPAEIIDVEPEE